ncbi:Pathogenesis-related protein 1B [Bienertia sinuspersici]
MRLVIIQKLCTLLLLSATIALTQAQDNQTQSSFLEMHNTVRAELGVAPLVWNHTLEQFAQTFAEKVKDTCNNTAQSQGPYGENTASGYGAFTIGDAVNQWVEEKPNYDHHMNKCMNGTECKHYTQVVWKETTQLGCANTTCGAGWPFVVCEYFPPGNVHGKWPY